jgi:hypothetical protein
MAATSVQRSLSTMGWKDMYRLALFEDDKGKILTRIADAEVAIATRERALFYAGSEAIEERKALEAALYALQALRGLTGVSRRTGRSSTNATTHDALWSYRRMVRGRRL